MLQAVEMCCLGVLDEVYTCMVCLGVQLKHPLCLVRKWKERLTVKSKQMMCDGEQLTSFMIRESVVLHQ